MFFRAYPEARTIYEIVRDNPEIGPVEIKLEYLARTGSPIDEQQYNRLIRKMSDSIIRRSTSDGKYNNKWVVI